MSTEDRGRDPPPSTLAPRANDVPRATSDIIGDLLYFLIGEIEAMSEKRFVQEFTTRTNINRRTAFNWLRHRSTTVRDASARALASYFRAYFPQAHEGWFQHYCVGDIAAELARATPYEVPGITGTSHPRSGISVDLPGVYQTIRYSFEAEALAVGDEAYFVVELMRIASTDEQMTFEHHFPIRRVDSPRERLVSRGKVLPMGDCYLLIGTHQVVEEGYSRPRTYLLPRTPAGVRQPIRYGLITSTASGNQRPCAARIVLQRIDNARHWSPEKFLEEVAHRVRFCDDAELRTELGRQADRLLPHIDNRIDPTTSNGFVLSSRLP